MTRRITVVASEVLGAGGVGGAGTADSMLAVALGRAGHEVDLLFARAEHVGALSSEWEETYASSGVTVRQLDARASVDPHYFTPTVDVFHMLRNDPPEVVIANDWRGLMLAPLRAREAGRAFADSAFVILCHGPSTVLVEFSQKVPDTLERFAMDVAERTAIGLADAVVSPSAWLLEWMRSRAWPVPDDAQVVQYISQATALGEDPPRAEAEGPIRRLAFFGQMREGKGMRILLSALNRIEPELLEGRELLFLGRVTRRWTPESVTAFLGHHVKERLAGIRFETALERSEALAELRAPGTLALMPSLLDNSPNTVSECIEQGIPFISSTAGGIPELVAEEDRGRVLIDPRPELLADALRRALTGPDGHPAARPARDPRAALEVWLEIVSSIGPPARRGAPSDKPSVSLVAVGGEETVARASRMSAATAAADAEVVTAASRAGGLAAASGDWVVFVDRTDVPDETMLDALVAAQGESGADVVMCAVRMVHGDAPVTRLFLGDPGSLGLIENYYGVVALIRRSVIDPEALVPEGRPDPMWPLLADLVLSGARIAVVPDPLCTYGDKPGTIRDVPGYALEVLHRFERARPPLLPLADLPLLAATLGAAVLSLPSARSQDVERSIRRLAARSRDVLREEGMGGLARRSVSVMTRSRRA